MSWRDWPSTAKAVAAGSILALGIPGVVALEPVFSQTVGKTLAVFTMDGPGARFATIYKLRDDGVLESTRRPVGGGEERHRLVLERADMERFLDLLRTGGYLTEAPENLRLPEVQNKLQVVVDAPHWRVRVHRSASAIVSVEVPSPIVGEVYPDLKNVPYVAVAWQLIKEFEKRWDRSQRVEPTEPVSRSATSMMAPSGPRTSQSRALLTYRALVSSGYVKRDGGWKMMFHQQTPLGT